MNQRLEISVRTIIITIVLIGLLRLLWLTRELIFALFLAFIFMSALKPIVGYLEKKKVPHTPAVIIVFTSLVLSIIFIFGFVLPPLITESSVFIRNFPALVENSFTPLSFYISPQSLNNLLPAPKDVFNVVKGVFSNVIFIISIIFFTFYFLLEEKFMTSFLSRFLEDSYVKRITDVFDKAEARMGAWVRGQLFLMTLIGFMTYIGLVFLGVPYAFPLAIIAGILEIVPIIGPVVSSIPAIFVSFSVAPVLGLAVIGLYIIVQQAENNIVVPLVMRKAVGLNPIVTLIAITVGGKLGGLLGMLLAVPAALVVETVLMELLKLQNK